MRLVRFLHGSARLRNIARRLCRNLTLSQSFHEGRIFFDAVEHSWAWTNKFRYETFDRDLQDCLLWLSHEYPTLVDIGANVGAMSLSVLLRNPSAKAIAVEPNPRAARLLNRSLRHNRLEERARVIRAACTLSAARVHFDFAGSVVGHVSPGASTEVSSLTPAALFAQLSDAGPLLTKLDVEGFETLLLPALTELCRRFRAALVVELHPLGWNSLGDPVANFEYLKTNGATLRNLKLAPLRAVDTDQFTSVVATWP